MFLILTNILVVVIALVIAVLLTVEMKRNAVKAERELRAMKHNRDLINLR